MSRPPKDSKLSKADIGTRVRSLREQRGLTQAKLAAALGLTQSNVSAMERGDRGLTIHQAVKLANACVAASGRRVDWIHIPVLDRSDDAFFAPLAALEPRGARVYLGAIHNMSRLADRIAVARRYLSYFGLGAYCGFGRRPVSELPDILADHLTAVDMASR